MALARKEVEYLEAELDVAKENLEGVAVSGELEGKELSRLAMDIGFWFSWVSFHPQTQLYMPAEMRT